MKNYENYLICIFININENVKKSIKQEKNDQNHNVLLTLELTKGTQKGILWI